MVDKLTGPSGATASLADGIARNLKAARLARGWSLDTLAGRSGVSKGMLVQVEAARTNPSIGTLCKLANALGVARPRLVDVADEPQRRHVTKADVAWLWKTRRGSAAGLVGGTDAPIPVELWDWRIAGRDHYDGLAHPAGTREILHVLSGTLTLTIGRTVMSVRSGESIVFHADRPHRYAAATARPVRFVMAVIEPVR